MTEIQFNTQIKQVFQKHDLNNNQYIDFGLELDNFL